MNIPGATKVNRFNEDDEVKQIDESEEVIDESEEVIDESEEVILNKLNTEDEVVKK